MNEKTKQEGYIRMSDHLQKMERSSARSKVMTESTPKVMGAFHEIYDQVCKDGVVPFKNKVLIAVGIGVAIRCQCCIDHHVQSAVRAGVKREEIVEALEVAILMGGGPSTHYGALALEAYDEIAQSETGAA